MAAPSNAAAAAATAAAAAAAALSPTAAGGSSAGGGAGAASAGGKDGNGGSSVPGKDTGAGLLPAAPSVAPAPAPPTITGHVPTQAVEFLLTAERKNAAALAAALPDLFYVLEPERVIAGFELFIVPQWYGAVLDRRPCSRRGAGRWLTACGRGAACWDTRGARVTDRGHAYKCMATYTGRPEHTVRGLPWLSRGT